MISCAQLGRHRPDQLVDGPRGEPQVDRAALLVAVPALPAVLVALALHVVEGPFHDRGQLVDVGRLEGGEAVLRHADQRRADRLVRAALGRQRDPGRRAGHDEARVLVAGIVQRIEAATHERIVERADGQQALAEQRVRQPERAEQQEQVHLGDAELEVLAPRAHLPLLRRQQPALLEDVLVARHGEQAAPVDPGPEVGRDRHIGRGSDDAVRQRPARARDLVEHAAEAGLGRHLALGLDPGERVDGHAIRLQAAPALGHERHAPEKGLHRGRGRVEPGELVPFLALVDALARAQVVHLRFRHQPGVVVLVALERQAVALDGVGDEAHRLVGRRLVEGLQDGLQVVPAEVGHELGERRIVVPAHEAPACRGGWRGRPPAAGARPPRPGTPAPSRACWGSRRSTL